jgi:LPS export ABC transporter permease LptG/LPS export ABC transporter permease LptF
MFRHWRLTKYVLRELTMPTLLALSLYTFVLLMNHIFLVAEKALAKNLSAELTLRLLAIGIPQLMILAIPMAVLLGTMIGVGRLNSDHEWAALQSAGHGISVLLRPVVLLALVGTLASLLIYAVLVPRSNFVARRLGAEVMFSSNLASDLKPRVFRDLHQGAVMFVEDIRTGVADKRLHGVLLIRPDEQTGHTQLVLARDGDLYPAPDGSGALLIDLYDGARHGYQRAAEDAYQYVSFKRAARIRLDPPPFIRALLKEPNKGIRDLNLIELWGEYRESLEKYREAEERVAASPAPRRRSGSLASGSSGEGQLLVATRRLQVSQVELHQRFALPVATLLLALLGLPLALSRVRSGKGAGFATSLLVILVYRVIFVLTRNQAALGKLSPALGVWTANGVMLVWALVLLWRLHRKELREGPLSRLWGSLWAVLADLRIPLRRKQDRAVRRPGEQPSLAEEARAELATMGGTSTRFIGRLDRYLGLAYLRVLVFALASIYLIFGLVELQKLVEGALESGQPMSLVAQYFQYFVPTVLADVLPVACLVGSVVGFTILARSSELVAMMASGIGLRRVTYAVIATTLLMCAVLFLVQDRITPAASRQAEELKDKILDRAPRTHGMPVTGRWGFGPEGKRLFHHRVFDPALREFRELSVFELDRAGPRIRAHRYAPRARYRDGAWDVEGGWYRTFAPDSLERFEQPYRLEMKLPRDWVEEELKRVDENLPAQLSIAELRDEIRKLNTSGYDNTRLSVAYYEKFSRCTTPLVMVLLGLPFAFKIGRRGSLYGIGVALLLVLVYWATFAVFNALGLERVLAPAIAAWTPNILFGLIGTYLLMYVKT